MTSDKIYKLIEDNGLTLHGDIEHFAALVREDEAERYKWDIHSCGPTCTKIGCVTVREAVKAEREACAKLLEEAAKATKNVDPQGFVWQAVKASAEVIRARGQA